MRSKDLWTAVAAMAVGWAALIVRFALYGVGGGDTADLLLCAGTSAVFWGCGVFWGAGGDGNG